MFSPSQFTPLPIVLQIFIIFCVCHNVGKHCSLPRKSLFILPGSYPLTLLSTGRIKVHGIGGGHKQRYRMIDFLRFRPEQETKSGPFEEKVIVVRYDPCRQVLSVGVMMVCMGGMSSVAFKKI